ncbi:MAG TPA: hypothetical protein VLQ93_10945, partial [Myxococcaceae bacterium]|nr:hypothetical protein [Myxococcaceae bacterium]
MAHPVPQHVHAAQTQLAAALEKAEGRPVDLLSTPWEEVEKSIPKLLGGAFQPNNPNHQGLALGVAGAFAERLMGAHQAFWFPNRDSPEAASVGFAEAVIMVSPFGAVMDALVHGKLAKLDDLAKDIGNSLGQARFAPGATQALGAQGPKLGPADYQRLFDPGFLQFVVLEPEKAKTAFESRPNALARDVRDALGRTQPPLPQDARKQFEGQIVGTLERLDAELPLSEQMEKAPRIAELVGHLFATVGGTGAAPEEFWGEIVLPLLFIGVPQQFPPADEEETQAFAQGAPVLSLFVDMVPHVVQAPDEGLLGVFEHSDLSLEHPGFGKVGALRLIKVNMARLKPLLEKFDADKTLDAVRRFTQYMEEKAGKAAPPNPQNEEMLKAAMVLLGDLKNAATAVQGDVFLRRLT